MTPKQQRAFEELVNALGIFGLLDRMARWLDRHPRLTRPLDNRLGELVGRYWYVPWIIAAVLGAFIPT